MEKSRRFRRYNFDGNLHRLKEASGTCEECSRVFIFMMTTKPRRFCDDCKEIAEKRALQIRNKRRREREAKSSPRPPKPKLIPYAGYDGS